MSKQDLDQRTADAANKQGPSDSAQANVERLRVLAATSGRRAVRRHRHRAQHRRRRADQRRRGGGPPMFVVSGPHKLRVYVNVPQTYVPLIRIGAKARSRCRNIPAGNFRRPWKPRRRSVDVASGTTQMQLSSTMPPAN